MVVHYINIVIHFRFYNRQATSTLSSENDSGQFNTVVFVELFVISTSKRIEMFYVGYFVPRTQRMEQFYSFSQINYKFPTVLINSNISGPTPQGAISSPLRTIENQDYLGVNRVMCTFWNLPGGYTLNTNFLPPQISKLCTQRDLPPKVCCFSLVLYNNTIITVTSDLFLKLSFLYETSYRRKKKCNYLIYALRCVRCYEVWRRSVKGLRRKLIYTGTCSAANAFLIRSTLSD